MAFIPALINNKEIKLYKFAGEGLEINKGYVLEPLPKDSNLIRICCLDLETTGLDNKSDEVIEIAMKLFEVDKVEATNVNAVKAYESYNEPKKPISKEITDLTGITPEMVRGKSIDWKEVSRLLAVSQIVVAHNATFDRGFLEQYVKTTNIWACSAKDVKWKNRGFFNQKLELLSIWHGFYYESHRAMNDVNATIHLLTHPSNTSNMPINELIINAKQQHYKIENTFPYNDIHIDLIKKRTPRYFYNREDKSWCIFLTTKKELDIEIEWLKENIYNGFFKGKVINIGVFDKYKDRV